MFHKTNLAILPHQGVPEAAAIYKPCHIPPSGTYFMGSQLEFEEIFINDECLARATVAHRHGDEILRQ